jgi:hypothetical protein
LYKQELKSLHMKKNLFGEPRVTPLLTTVYAEKMLVFTTNSLFRRPESFHHKPVGRGGCDSFGRNYATGYLLFQMHFGAPELGNLNSKVPGWIMQLEAARRSRPFEITVSGRRAEPGEEVAGRGFGG